MTDRTCGTCRHSSHGSDAMECAKRPGWATWEGGACEDWRESNWQRYFGTPERTRETLAQMLGAMECRINPRREFPISAFCRGGERLAEWLEADAE